VIEMDNELLLSLAILAGVVVATAFERRAKAARAPICVLVKVPESITSFDRREKYADPLDGALLRESLGRVTGSEVGISVELTALEEFTRNRVHVVESVMHLYLEPGTRYRVIKAFTDHDRDVHPVGEEWTFLRSAFVPYHSGMSCPGSSRSTTSGKRTFVCKGYRRSRARCSTTWRSIWSRCELIRRCRVRDRVIGVP
jgi:hypothetical protein